jgi:phosphopantothenoylcysteine decarboxylase/phosphopantothenate--cysteine ligase
MDAGMFSHPATQANLHVLEGRGTLVVGPEEGHLASGLVAKGRMTEPIEIVGQIRYHLSRGGPLAGRKMVVTAGGTQEPLDPVRYLTNRSSGKQGLALAQAAVDAGADVVLIATPVVPPAPAGVARGTVRSAGDMAQAVVEESRDADALIMAAAVADFRPVREEAQKIKKGDGGLVLELTRTPDILAEVGLQRQASGCPAVVVGFAAETENLLENALGKLEAKELDLIVANDVSADDAGFAVDTNRVTLLDTRGSVESLPLLPKEEVARQIVERIVGLLSSKGKS